MTVIQMRKPPMPRVAYRKDELPLNSLFDSIDLEAQIVEARSRRCAAYQAAAAAQADLNELLALRDAVTNFEPKRDGLALVR